jgi:hypothetical protein
MTSFHYHHVRNIRWLKSIHKFNSPGLDSGGRDPGPPTTKEYIIERRNKIKGHVLWAWQVILSCQLYVRGSGFEEGWIAIKHGNIKIVSLVSKKITIIFGIIIIENGWMVGRRLGLFKLTRFSFGRQRARSSNDWKNDKQMLERDHSELKIKLHFLSVIC